ncbi:MFS general substrate transporter [Tricholoma matsutake]|nr:MFS general substrate transporter [Tricholoma matsutake 945]
MSGQDNTTPENGVENYPHERNERNEQTTAAHRRPLPKFQLFIVFLIQFAEPVTATVIYPFINQFVRETGVTGGDERKTGYFAGIIESAFFISEALTVFHWGWASDRYGRRPVLLLGPLGLSIALGIFGLSKGFWLLVISRCFQGVFNGNIGVSKTVIAEITDASNIADAFAFMPLMWSCGVTIGPLLGGVLSNPATTWPDTFGKILFFHDHPYFLPCAIAALVALISSLVASVGLKETLPSAIVRRKEEKKRYAAAKAANSNPNSTTGLLSDDNDINDINYGSTVIDLQSGCNNESTAQRVLPGVAGAPPPLHTLLVPRVMITMTSYGFLAFVDMCVHVLQPLVYSTSIPLGGLGFDPYRIGTIMGAWGLINALVQGLLLGPTVRQFGARKSFIASQISYVASLASYPLLTFFARRAGRVNAKVWVVLIVQLILRMASGLAYGSGQIIIVNSAPRASLGATTGMAQAIASAMRSIAPTVASSLFSISLQSKLAGGNMIYFILTGIAIVGVRVSLLLPKSIDSASSDE